MINRNCTCSREPLMALNLHQARTGGWKRKSQPASHYTLHLHPLTHTLTHTHTGYTGGDSRPQEPACHISSLCLHLFISFQMHYISDLSIRRYPLRCKALTGTHRPGTEDISQSLNSISSLTTASASPHIIAAAQESSCKVKI